MISVIIIIIIVLSVWCLIKWTAADLDYIYKGKTIYFGHRGERHAAPENTIPSYLCAVDNGFTAIELDVRTTKNGKLVCSHNIDLERETLGAGFIDELTYAELQPIKAGKDFQENAQSRIPLLEEVLKTLSVDILLNIEIKSDYLTDIRAAKVLASLIKQDKIKHKILVSSFNPIVVRYIKLLCKNVPTGYIYEHAKHFKGVFIAKPDCLHPDAEFIDKKLIEFCHKRKMRINTWTVNNVYARDWLIEKGIAGIITDNPKLLT